MRAATACFKRWLAVRGHKGAAEDAQAVEAVRAFIGAHGASRFEDEQNEETEKEAAFDNANGPARGPTWQRIINRAGFRRRADDGQIEYLILPTVWRGEVCRGLDVKRAAEVVAKRGYLLGWSARHPADSVRIRGHGRMRVYRVPERILEGDDDE